MNNYQEVYKAIKTKLFIEDIMEYLDEINFRFISGHLLKEVSSIPEEERPKKFRLGFKFPKRKEYQWMVRVLKYGKKPKNDQFDFTLLIGIKWIGKKKKSILIYYKGVQRAKLVRDWRQKDNLNMKKKKVPMKFPDIMTIDERKRWRSIRRRVEMERNINEKDQKFHDRFLGDIRKVNEGKGFNL
jgi:hypothetical protein